MYLLRARLIGFAPFDDVAFPFSQQDGAVRHVTVVHGGGGVGKTTLLAALAATRPGHAVVHPPRFARDAVPPASVCDWGMGMDDPERPHVLRVVTPNAQLSDGEGDDVLQRREQALFDRKARAGGFAFVAFSAARWFSRQPIVINAPERTVTRYDVRASIPFDDAGRADLARETKQALAYAAIASSLADAAPTPTRPETDPRLLGAAMHQACDTMVALSGHTYRGVHPRSLEPVFESAGGRMVTFDGLPTRARHLVAFATLTTRVLWAAYPGLDPRRAEGVALIDEVDLHQDLGVQAELVPALRRALPRVQWIVTTTSPVVAASCAPSEVIALRRLPDAERTGLYLGDEAVTH